MKIILILLVLATTVIFTGMFIRTTMSSVGAAAPAFDYSNCQYPNRESNPPNGCDNTDPARPECMKSGKENCDLPSNPSVIVEQPVKSNTVKHKTCKL